ncbi:HD family phosphohydrolase [Ruminococcaceae bacterium OttesenSCG-928-A16]|nr:HD family phosphohydrolase [Ruminococcaceae bacterium OttesenSCG-928-A16]
MWKPENRLEFEEIIEDLLADPAVQSMRDLPQHSKSCNCFEHSLYVSYLTFLACRRLKLDYVGATRAALLHDFALRNWDHDDMGLKRLWKHPHLALENAEQRYLLTDMQKDIIVKHMWPLTRPLPRHKESFVVSMADKLCALMEMSHLYRLLKVRKKLAPANT